MKKVLIGLVLAIFMICMFALPVFADDPPASPLTSGTNVTVTVNGDNPSVTVNTSGTDVNINGVPLQSQINNAIGSSFQPGWASDFTQTSTVVNQKILPWIKDTQDALQKTINATSGLIAQGGDQQKQLVDLQNRLSKLIDYVNGVDSTLKSDEDFIDKLIDNVNSINNELQDIQKTIVDNQTQLSEAQKNSQIALDNMTNNFDVLNSQLEQLKSQQYQDRQDNENITRGFWIVIIVIVIGFSIFCIALANRISHLNKKV